MKLQNIYLQHHFKTIKTKEHELEQRKFKRRLRT